MKRFQRIEFVSKAEALKMEPRKGWAIISINNPGEEYPKLMWNDALYMRFHDVAASEHGKIFDGINGEAIEVEAFQPKDAVRIIEFIEGCGKEIYGIVVHCTMGISRSAAVAEFIRRRYSELERLNRSIDNMNRDVYRMLEQEWFNKHGVF